MGMTVTPPTEPTLPVCDRLQLRYPNRPPSLLPNVHPASAMCFETHGTWPSTRDLHVPELSEVQW